MNSAFYSLSALHNLLFKVKNIHDLGLSFYYQSEINYKENNPYLKPKTNISHLIFLQTFHIVLCIFFFFFNIEREGGSDIKFL